jgi:hypothetical protein
MRNVLARLLVISGCAATLAQAGPIIVQATTDIWLAGQPGGTVTGYFGTDTGAANSPVQVGVAGGEILTFSASGSTSVDDICYAGPDGGCYTDQSSFSPAPAGGVYPNDFYNGPADALVGVFLNDGVPMPPNNGSNVPTGFVTGLDYQAGGGANQGLPSYSPALNQIFFIGDGLTGTGSGSVQDFIVPTGATSLYLAVADSVGGSTGNLGSLDVTVNGASPEPASFLLLGAGLAVAGLLRRRAVRR